MLLAACLISLCALSDTVAAMCSRQLTIKTKNLSYKHKRRVVKIKIKTESISSLSSHQEFALLFPLGALSVGVSVGLRHQVDHLPLVPGGLWTGLESFHHFLLLAPLPVLLN